MKKSNLMKIVSILVISLIVMVFATNVYAAEDEEGFDDITNALTNSNTNTNTNNANTNTNNSLTGNTNTLGNTNNSSVYNNTNLPKTGVSDSIPVVMLVVVFGISAVYAYKKIKEYKNI